MKKLIPKEIRIIFAGFIGGFFSGFAIKTGLSLNPDDWKIIILKNVCKVTKGTISFNCYAVVSMISVIFAFLTFLTVWKKARTMRRIRIFRLTIPGFVVGLAIYFIGFIFGIYTIIRLLS